MSKEKEGFPSYPIYLDYNATTPLAPEVVHSITTSLIEDWGNPSSNYALGKKAKSAIEQSRTQVARMINASSSEIIFTSGGTEANSIALISAIKTFDSINFSGHSLPHVICSVVEHDSVINPLKNQKNIEKIDLSIAQAEKSGKILVENVISLIRKETVLISLMHANNETGVMMPIQQLGIKLQSINAERAKVNLPKIFFHSDAAQTIGKLNLDVKALNVDFLTIVGHKFYGPRIGALYVRNLGQSTLSIIPLALGGGQEKGFRPGTENTPMIVGLGKACELVTQLVDEIEQTMKSTRDYFQTKLMELMPNGRVNFNEEQRLPNTLSFCLPCGMDANKFLEDAKDKICASLGSACHTGKNKPSDVLLACGLTEDEARRTIRFSIGRNETTNHIDMALEAIISIQNLKLS